ncbi:ROK family protein [Ornithinibacillus scapharcae]|uniref:ROK family protein n=1 Tax=Ornithinibacillus scapharcae TaxID=1147159 RepID=UPI000225BCF1|nr:ROK family protein [Ornithinibacillus scapharcae]
MKILGVDIGGTSIKLCIADEFGNIETFQEYDSEAKKGGPHLIHKVISIIEDYSGFEAIGISTAGQVNIQEGSIRYANENIPNYTGMQVKSIIENHFNLPVRIENDVNAAALGENFFGNGRNFHHFICVTYGTGIGGAIVMNSDLYRGANGSAAEFGHIMTHPRGKRCNCGLQGCYEMYGSTTALVQEARKVYPDLLDGRAIFHLYHKGNESLQLVVHNWIEEVALGLTSLVHTFNPEAIILGGGVMEQDDLVTMLANRVKDNIMESFSNIAIIKAGLGNKAGVLGAISLHTQKNIGRSFL